MERFKIQRRETINIGDNNLIESVICNKPSCEGYDVKNLISNKFVDKSKGFLAERFITPPVIITFQFKSSVNIQYIVVNCKVGAQKTSGIEILCQPKIDSEYVSLGSGVLDDNKYGLVFHRYDKTVNDKFGEQYLLRTFKPRSYLSLSSVRKLQIKIFRTSGTSVPAISKVEFWGIPHNVEQLSKQENKICKAEKSNHVDLRNELNPSADLSISSRKSNNLSATLKCQQFVSIPEDFVDPITYDVMTLPVIMPSGKIIDNSTLESYEKAERLWGRGPNDPFTGVPFTDSNKPVAATDLKARIDQYLSVNSNCTELYNLPRTVGRVYSNLSSRSLCKAGVSKLIKHSSSKSGDDIGSTPTTVTFEENIIKSKRRKLDSNAAETVTKREINSQSVTSVKLSKNNTCVTSKFANKSCSFQDRMDQSLELALRSTLSQLPNLTADKPKIGETLISCNVCKSVNNLFSIPCNHLICRNCLVNESHKSQMSCLSCNTTYRRNDLNKIHVL